MIASSHFKGKRITVMGLGLLGRGVGDAKYLAAQGAELIVTDLKAREELAESVKELEAFSNITFVLGEHRLEDFQNRDLILKAAGVPLDSPYIAEAKKNNIPVRMSADLFAEYAGIPVVGVTGTRGKSTTTHMIAAIAEAAGMKVLVGGNVRGVSTLALLQQVAGDEIAVLELDSWQLQGFGEAHLSPSLAVFTTFFPDHLNYYKNDLSAYLADKANIFFYQTEGDTLVLGGQCSTVVLEAFGDAIEADVVITDDTKLPEDWKLTVLGNHNRYDAACALAAARALDIRDEVSRKALESFMGVDGRLQFVREANGVKIYNDTTATTPEATLAALSALDPEGKKNIVLIMGGNDKGLDMNKLLHEIPQHTKRVIMLSGTGTSRVLEFLPEASVFDSLQEAVKEAAAAAGQGDNILFSPAFTSFGMFKNEYDRGDKFNALVNAL
jgi:UDP-N-acetylmuramoylalanine--D-glutamate ligase